MKEKWIPIKGYEGLYEISNYGKVKSLPRRQWNGYVWWVSKEKILKSNFRSTTYAQVGLTKDGKTKIWQVHTLVLINFVGPCPNGMEARHFPDRNPWNNRVDNLSWCSSKQNKEDMIFHGTKPSANLIAHRGSAHVQSKLNEHLVVLMRVWFNCGIPYNKIQRRLIRKYRIDVTKECIGMAIRGVTWRHVK